MEGLLKSIDTLSELKKVKKAVSKRKKELIRTAASLEEANLKKKRCRILSDLASSESIKDAILESEESFWEKKKIKVYGGDDFPCTNDGDCYYVNDRGRMSKRMTFYYPIFESNILLCDVCHDNCERNEIIFNLLKDL